MPTPGGLAFAGGAADVGGEGDWQVEMLVSERKWDQLVAAGWPPDLASGFLTDWLVQVPWRDWEAGLAPWVVETSDWPYLNEKKWPRTKVNHPVISVRPKRLISAELRPVGTEGGVLCVQAVPSHSQLCVRSVNVVPATCNPPHNTIR